MNEVILRVVNPEIPGSGGMAKLLEVSESHKRGWLASSFQIMATDHEALRNGVMRNIHLSMYALRTEYRTLASEDSCLLALDIFVPVISLESPLVS